MKLSEEQRQIVETKAPFVLVQATPGAGKTRTIIERARFLISNDIPSKDIVILTYTTTAAQELRDRIGIDNNEAFIGTLHSYCFQLLLRHGVNVDEYCEGDKFDEMFSVAAAHPEFKPDIDYLLLDEGQDSTDAQFSFIFDYLKPKHYMVVYDPRQAIFRWHGADPDYLIGLSGDPDVTNYELRTNYRCGSAIINFAKGLIRTMGPAYIDKSVAGRTNETGAITEFTYTPDKLVDMFRDREDAGDWFILTRTNIQLEEIAKKFDDYKIPYVSFKRSELTNAELAEQLRANKVKLLTIHAAKGLESKNVIVVGAKFYNLEERCISYVAATRAKDLLIWTRWPTKKTRSKAMVSWES